MSLPPHDPMLNARRTGYTRRGFAAQYHAHRPKPPAALLAERTLWPDGPPWYVSYRVRVGVK